ncbi:hypothetical protein [uncultured Prevotella sp.]|uniref:hypothetical protein n=1 Tax=uncultured Prevotella sp. TaxID=159272 RepID=UPI0025973A46|nr:hypothetical protein [uncultured Prevotella sp.]
MITNFIHECRHVVAVTAITLLIALFGNVEEAVGGVTLTPSSDWSTGHEVKTVTINVDAAGDFAKYMNDRGGQLATEYKSYDNIVYKGPANVADFVALNRLTNPRLNLCQLTFDESDEKLNTAEMRLAELNTLSNSSFQFIALPDAGADITNHNDQLFKTLYDNMSQLRGVAYYHKATKSYTCYSKYPGEVYILTTMSEGYWGGNQWNQFKGTTFNNLKISGNFNAKDISGNIWGATYDKDGHFVLVSDDESKVGGTTTFASSSDGNTDNCAWVGAGVVISLDLQDAKFTNIADLTLSKTYLVSASTTTVLIPTDPSITELPPDFLNLSSAMKEICIPRNIEKIGARAFLNQYNLNHVTTTDAEGKVIDFGYGKKVEKKTFTAADGTSWTDHVVDSTQTDENSGTVVFSDNLKEIDSYVFSSMSHVKDVYVLATEALACHVNAFSTDMYTGNNGFDPAGSITRLDYQNQGFWITMLHYPNSVKGTDEEKRYTDVTRDYTITDADGNTDGWGNVIHWPNQTEFTRAYEQGTNGYLWRAWDTSREPWSQYGSCQLNKSDHNYQMTQVTANQYYDDNKAADRASSIFYHTATDGGEDVDGGAYANVKTADGKPLYDRDYRGWHQFSLAESYDYQNTTPEHNFSYINDNGWWTICVPFDMTKAEVRTMFGTDGTHGGPHVCEFTGVLRDANADGQGKGKIVLKFDRDVYKWIYNADGTKTATADDNIVIHKGVPYLLQPDYKEKVDGNVVFIPSQHILRDPKCKAVSSAELQDMAMKNVVEVTAKDAEGNEDQNYKYTFIGNFWQTEMPGYAYFLAWYQPTDGSKGLATFFWQEKQAEGTMNWNPYTAIIGCNWNKDNRKMYVPQGGPNGLDNVHWFARLGNVQNGASVFGDDSFETTGGAKANGPQNVSIEADGNIADGITKVHFGNRTIDIFHGKVYNLNGQYVGDSLEGLPKGIYIAGGKKYIVK